MNERWFSPIDRTLKKRIKIKIWIRKFWFDTTSYKELIDLRIKYQYGYFKFLVPKDRVQVLQQEYLHYGLQFQLL